LHCQQEIRFFNFFFLNRTIQSSSHSSEIVSFITLYWNASQMEDACHVSLILGIREDVQHY